ncbi:MAG: hypothetical protein AB9888_17920 [Bacteroidales bacterium]
MKKLNHYLGLVSLLLISGLCYSQEKNTVSSEEISSIKSELKSIHGIETANRIEKGVSQLAQIWDFSDDNAARFREFCIENFLSDAELNENLPRIAENLILTGGSLSVIRSKMNEPFAFTDVKELHADRFFRKAVPSYNPYTSELAYFLKLNFPEWSLDEKRQMSTAWDRNQWIMNAIGGYYPGREVERNATLASKQSEFRRYIDNYFFDMHRIMDAKGNYPFSEVISLHCHRGLRDNTKEEYTKEGGFERQKLTGVVLEKVFTGEVPVNFLTDKNTRWNPSKNELYTIEGKKLKRISEYTCEDDLRYEGLKNLFNIEQAVDSAYGNGSTYITRTFENANLTVDETEKIIVDILESPLAAEVSRLVQRRLNRKLHPFDVWYSGFQEQSYYSAEYLDSLTRARYPDPGSLEDNIKDILMKMGFPEEEAFTVGASVNVHSVVSGGYSDQPPVQGGKALLTTMFGERGLDYKGYRVAMHELGHVVCGVYSTLYADNFLLAGVPTGGITEGFAEVFAYKNIEGLGLFPYSEQEKKHLLALATYWYLYEMGGNALTEIRTWKWMYNNPDATVDELKNAVLGISAGIWNNYFSENFGGARDCSILSVYNHFITGDLYLFNYFIGGIVSYQLADAFERDELAPGLKESCREGATLPELWMQKAVGSGFSLDPLLNGVSSAVEYYSGRTE